MRKWFTIPYLILLSITIGLVGFLLIRGGINNSYLILNVIEQQITNQVNDQLSQGLKEAMQLNQINHNSLQSGILNLESQPERERYFSSHLKSFPDVAMTFVGLEDGSFYGARRIEDGSIQIVRRNDHTDGGSWYYQISDTGEGTILQEKYPNFDPRTRPWYRDTVGADSSIFSEVYIHFTFHEPTITASYPIYDGNRQLKGVFGVNYLLSWLGESLAKMPIGKSGQIFITDEKGMLIASSIKKQAYRTVDGALEIIPALESDNELIKASLSFTKKEYEGGSQRFSHNSKNYYAHLSHFGEYGFNWDIYIVSAEEDFLGDIKAATFRTFIILIASLLISMLVTTLITNRITKPVLALCKAAEALSNGTHIPLADKGRKDELGVLIRCFNKTSSDLIRVLNHLEEEVNIRTQELNQKNRELEQLSFFDGLTGIANRRLFDETISRFWDYALHKNCAIALFMLDIDLFKKYNDTYGHQAGDQCLKDIGALLRSKVRRSNELVARYGGEEFALIIQDPEVGKLFDLGENIRKSIEDLEIEHINSPFKKVTISIGIAYMVPTRGTDPNSLIKMADQALYEAKEKGRNLVSGTFV